MLLDELKRNREKILTLAAECGLTDVRVFGSVARGEERPDSDIDILIHYIPGGDPFRVFAFQRQMEKLIDRKVELLFDGYVRKNMLQRIIKDVRTL